MDELKKARENIDRIDKELARLFEERMTEAASVAAYKREHGLPIFDPSREAEVLEKGLSRIENEKLRDHYASFLKNLMKISKSYQRELSEGMRIAYSGVEGAFAHIAAGKIFEGALRVGYKNFAEAYRAVESGECYAAVLPIENSYAGEVGEVTDLLFSGSLSVSGMYDLAVVQDLLAVPGTKIENVREVVSHPQALAQCADFIRAHGFKTVVAENTALAAKAVKEAGRHDLAAIASAESAELFSLSVLDHNLNASTSNTTRFAVFTRARHALPPSARMNGRFILVFTVSNEAGALARAIDVIGKFGFNMRNLRSRPLKNSMWKYYFYAEAEGNIDTSEGRAMLAALGELCDKLKVAGSYIE